MRSSYINKDLNYGNLLETISFTKNPNNISKIDKKRSPPVEWERPEADLGAIWWRRRSKDEFSSIWGHFWIDLGRIFDKFRLILDVVFHGFDAALASTNRVACK